MERFDVNVAPASPRTGVTATLDALQKNAQLYYQGADIVWMMMCSGMVFLMVPAMSLFYSGATSRQSSLKLFRLPLITAAVVGFQWYLWGYCLAFTPAVPTSPSSGSSWYGWDTRGLALRDSTARPVGLDGPKIPELVYMVYESMFASFTAALVCGGTVRDHPQSRFPSGDVPTGRFLIFISLWSLLVYDPVARWTWHWAGWSNGRGVLDFAGGTAVHITSGTTVLAFYVFYAIQTGRLTFFKRIPKPQPVASHPTPAAASHPTTNGSAENDSNNDNDRDSLFGSDHSHREDHEQAGGQSVVKDGSHADIEMGTRAVFFADTAPHNVNNVVLGTALLWFGWYGFNGGSALGGNLRAVSAIASTHMAACAGGTCMLLVFWGMNYLDEAFDRRQSTDRAKKRTTSVTHFCDGVVIALVAITPGAGFVPVWSSAVFGIVSTIVIYFFKRFTAKFLYDHPLYIFAIHAGGGFVGMILTGAFADADIVGLDGYSTIPERSRGTRVGFQIADAVTGFSYTFCMTMVILQCLKVIRTIIRGNWSAGFKQPAKSGGMRLVATPQQEWLNLTPNQPLDHRRTSVPPAEPLRQHSQPGPSNAGT